MIKVFYSDISDLSEEVSIDEFCTKRKIYVQNLTSGLRKKQSVYVWKLLLKALDICNIFRTEFIVQNGKWGLKDNNIKFSLSHSNNVVIVGISNNEIGVDVEMFSDKLLRVSKKLFPAQKIPKNKTEKTFYGELWTKRECQIKNHDINQKFYSQVIIDKQNNKYLVGIISSQKARLEKIELG